MGNGEGGCQHARGVSELATGLGLPAVRVGHTAGILLSCTLSTCCNNENLSTEPRPATPDPQPKLTAWWAFSWWREGIYGEERGPRQSKGRG